jgi:hypothetical protein
VPQPVARSGPEDLDALALGKLTKILGEGRGSRVFAEVLAATGLRTLSTPEELYTFAQHLTARAGMESAVGGVLSVAAVIRGAASTAGRR